MKKILSIVLLVCVFILTAACGKNNALEGFEKLDVSGYAGLDGYTKDTVFVEGEVKDALKLMDEGKSFVLFMSFAKCPWCNAVISHLNNVALDEGMQILSINTRKDPSWQSNSDLKDFDLFVERFGEFLSDTENGKKLYVPHIFFIKKGKVVYEHQGAIPAMGSDPNYVLNEQEIKELEDIFREGFSKIK